MRPSPRPNAVVRMLVGFAGLVGLIGLAAGCGADATNVTQSGDDAAPAAEAPASESGAGDSAAGVDAFPDLTLATTAGTSLDFNSLEGTDTVLWFWAPW